MALEMSEMYIADLRLWRALHKITKIIIRITRSVGDHHLRLQTSKLGGWWNKLDMLVLVPVKVCYFN